MFNEIKLEKSMYNLTNKNFNQVLEELDPSENYIDTPYASLDAFERQLKRFDIRISGKDCDKAAKFFETTEGAVLFPEYVRRSIQRGFEDCFISDVTAADTFSESNYYAGCDLSESGYDTTISEGNEFPTSIIKESSGATALKKYGRTINVTYEGLKNQRLDLISVYLRSIGKRIAAYIMKELIDTLEKGAESIDIAGDELTYSDITSLYGTFKGYDMNIVIVSPDNAGKVLAMPQMMESSSEKCGEIYFPFGAKMITSTSKSSSTILGMDSRFALETVRSTDIILETDKLIERQFNKITVSINIGFRKIFGDAVKVLAI
jgi:hypothetical protein